MAHETLKVRITGVSPLIMHRGGLADPLDQFTREMKRVSSKRSKTEADFAELSKLEFFGGLYLSGGEPCIPGEAIEAMLIVAAKKKRRGDQAKAGLICDQMPKLEYEGPREPEKLWEDARFRLTVGVRVQRNKIMRTRPMFRQWAADVEVKFLPSLLNRDEVREFFAIAGEVVGLLDWRPKFGRFTIS